MGKVMRNRIHGFTLLETLVALSILAISIGIVYQVFASSLRSTELANDYVQASMYVDSHLASISRHVHQLRGETEGRYNDRFRWKLRVQSLESNSSAQFNINDLKTYQVILQVFWKGKHGPRSIRATTFRLSGG